MNDEIAALTDSVTALTRKFRSGSDPFFFRLRKLLAKRGFDPERTALWDVFSDGLNYEFCVIVPATGPVARFGYSYPDADQGNGRIVDWDDAVDPFTDPAEVEAVREVARQHLS
jgi:hypothetical protein